MQEQRQDLLDRGPRSNYSELQLAVLAGDRLETSVALCRLAGTPERTRDFDFGNIEGRTDASGQRVWLIDRAAQHVIATLDCTNGSATGPHDEAPAWAVLDGGKVLEPVQN